MKHYIKASDNSYLEGLLGLTDENSVCNNKKLPRLGKLELVCLLSFTCNYVIFVWRGFLFLWVLGMGYVILLWHSHSLPYNYFSFLKSSKHDKTGSPPLQKGSRLVTDTTEKSGCT